MSYAYFAPDYSAPILSEMFGTGHAAWAPTSFTLVLGKSRGGTPSGTGQAAAFYTATATVPNDNAHWTSNPPYTVFGTLQPGYWANAQPITFSALSSTDVSGWDFFGGSLTLEDGAGTQLACMDCLGGPMDRPFVGLQIGIGPGTLRWMVL